MINIQEQTEKIARGSRGGAVRELQVILNILGHTDAERRRLVPDGSFGPRTEHAVNSYKDAVLPGGNKGANRGVVGATTWNRLRASLADVMSKAAERQILAVKILFNDRIILHPAHISPRVESVDRLSDTLSNIVHTAQGGNAFTTAASVVSGTGGRAANESAELDSRMLNAVLAIANEFGGLQVTSITGGRHSQTSQHHHGRAVDIDIIGGRRAAGMTLAERGRFVNFALNLLHAGSLLGPHNDPAGHGSHFHLDWRPR